MYKLVAFLKTLRTFAAKHTDFIQLNVLLFEYL